MEQIALVHVLVDLTRFREKTADIDVVVPDG
jgi:hypothetical protein